jgi:sporulation protein YlmC with PRC-barrel domain
LLEKKKFVIIRYALYAVAAVLATMVLSIGSKWILNMNEPYVSFADFITAIIIAMFTAYISSMLLKEMRMEMLLRMKLDGKEVINEHGAFLGKVVGVNGTEGNLILQTVFDKRLTLALNGISAINDNNIVVKGSA